MTREIQRKSATRSSRHLVLYALKYSVIRLVCGNTCPSTQETTSSGATSVRKGSHPEQIIKLTWINTKGSLFLVRNVQKDSRPKFPFVTTSQSTLGCICTDALYAIRGIISKVTTQNMRQNASRKGPPLSRLS